MKSILELAYKKHSDWNNIVQADLPNNDICKSDENCVVTNAKATVDDSSKAVPGGIDLKNIKCTKPDPTSNECTIPNYIANDGKMCEVGNLISEYSDIQQNINGNSLSSLCVQTGLSSNPICKSEIMSNNYKCPWIGYDLFKDGAKDGTYTFNPNTDDETNPYWCFTES